VQRGEPVGKCLRVNAGPGIKGLEGGGKEKGDCARVTCAAPLPGRGVGDRCGVSATSGMERQVHRRRREVASGEADELAGIRRTSCEGEGEGAGPAPGVWVVTY
jgi:hypothetical protein